MADEVALPNTVSAAAGAAQPSHPPPRAAHVPLELSIISNSCLLRDGVASLLGHHLSFRLVGSYPGEPGGAADLPSPHGHIVLLDDNIGRMATLGWLRYWRARVPAVTVLILDLADNPDRIVEYIENGASGYTLQSATAAEVATAVMQLHAGGALCSPEVTAHLFARLAHLRTLVGRQSEGPPLTGREMEVLRGLANQMTNREIAEQLVIEVRTVKHHVHNILEKLNQSRRGDAVRCARELGWLGEEAFSSLG